MSAVWVRLRAELRGRWLALAVLAAMLGVFGGAVIAAAAGARRADTVVSRAVAAERGGDIFIANEFVGEGGTTIGYEDVVTLPEVETAARFTLLGAQGDVEVAGPLDPHVGTELERPKVLEGRLYDPRALGEVMINFKAAERLHLRVGSTLPVRFLAPGSASPEEASSDEVRSGPVFTFRVVGITAVLGDFVQIAGSGVAVTPAFLRAHAREISTGELIVVRLRHGDADLRAFRRSVDRLVGGRPTFFVEAAADREAVRRSFHVQAVALWALAGFLALPVLVVFGQTLAREIFLHSAEYPMLRALGMTPRQLVGVAIARATAVGGGAAILAVGVAAALSPLTPLGLVRVAEPDPGFALDLVAMGFGVAVIVGAVLAFALVPAWRAARAEAGALGVAEIAPLQRPSAVAGLVSRVTPGAGPSVGVRLAVEPGHGRTAVPVRATMVGTTVGLLALAMALTVAANLDHLLSTPRLYGWNWDATVSGDFEEDSTPLIRAVESDPDVESFSIGVSGAPLQIGDVATGGVSISPVRGRVLPTVLEGRAPATPKEILLGRKTMRLLHARLGSSFDVHVSGTKGGAKMRVVGIGVPPISGLFASDVGSLGDGVVITQEGLQALYRGAPVGVAFIRFRGGTQRAAVARLRRQLGDEHVQLPRAPTDVVDFGRVSSMPHILGGLLAALAAATLAHGLVTSIRRRRRDLAILKTLGFVTRQVRGAVAWQASTFTIISLLLGIPVGVAAGRWVWMLFADQSGFAAEPVVALSVLALVVPVALVLANVIAAIPARSAARTQPALVLRTE
jgi:putative ABC transport system permease protein